MVPIKADASFAEDPACQTLTIVKNVLYRRKIEMVVQRLSTWVVPKQTCSTKERNMASGGTSNKLNLFNAAEYPTVRIVQIIVRKDIKIFLQCKLFVWVVPEYVAFASYCHLSNIRYFKHHNKTAVPCTYAKVHSFNYGHCCRSEPSSTCHV